MYDAGGQFTLRLDAVLERLVNPQWGVICRLHADRNSVTGLHVVHTSLASPGYFRANGASQAPTAGSGTGAAFDAESAYWSAIGEAVERYCASIYRLEDLVCAAGEDLPTTMGLDPLIQVAVPSVRPYDQKAARYWARGRKLSDGSACFVPAQLTYLGYQPQWPEEILGQNDSTGLACGVDFETACSAAFFELVERDAFASAWLLTHRPSRIQLAAKDYGRLGSRVAGVLRRACPELRLFHLASSFGVHTVMSCLLTSEGTGLVAAAASPSLARAMEKSVVEVLQGANAATRLSPKPRPKCADDIRSTSDHALYYLDAERFAVVADWLRGTSTITIDEIQPAAESPANFGDIVQAGVASGLDPVAVDLTTADMAALGLSVVRVLVPGLQPLVFGSACVKVPDRRRLDFWRGVWGTADALLNPYPHPFP